MTRVTARRAAIAALTLTVLGGGNACGGREPEIRSVLLITVDTLRADFLGAYGSSRGLTPNLDVLAEKSLVFDAAYAPAPFTFPSIAGIFTGRHPSELNIQANTSAIPVGVPTLATAVRARGWQTGAVVSNFVLRDKTGLADDFDLYDDAMREAEATRMWPERTAADTTDAALAAAATLAEDRERPWLLWVHYQDPHGPYTPPAGWREPYLDAERRAPHGEAQLPKGNDHTGRGAIPDYQVIGEERDVGFYRAGYAAEIAYTDAEIGRLLDTLAERGVLDHTLLVFAADHGEALGETGFWFAHGHDLRDELTRTPLFVHGPGIADGRRSDVVSLLDLFPTLLAQIGIDTPTPEVRGRDLLAEGAEGANSIVYLSTLGGSAEPGIAIVRGGHKLVLTFRDATWALQLFRRGHEDEDLAIEAPRVAGRLRRQLAELQRLHRPSVEERRQEMSAEDLEQLRALGYVEERDGP